MAKFSPAPAQTQDDIVATTVTADEVYSKVDEHNFVVVTGGEDDRDTNTAAYSTDGITWTETTLPTTGGWDSVAYGDSKFVALVLYDAPTALHNKAAYSTDGVNWTQTALPADSYWDGVAFGDGTFVAISAYNAIAAYSTDGINWTQTTLPASRNWQSVAYGAGKFVATASNSDFGAYSTDGITWTEQDMRKKCTWDKSVFGGTTFLHGDTSNAAYSTDGITWASMSITQANWSSAAYGADKFVIVARSPYGYSGPTDLFTYSTDNGASWTDGTLPSAANWRGLTFSNNKFVVFGENSNKFAYSTDGITWTESTLPSTASWFASAGGDIKKTVNLVDLIEEEEVVEEGPSGISEDEVIKSTLFFGGGQ